jgi:hypothetical protein
VEENELRNARIRAAGVVQAVIASGAPVGEWGARTRYGLRQVNYWAAVLMKQPPKGGVPAVPKELKGK